jgi:hypothetical protein
MALSLAPGSALGASVKSFKPVAKTRHALVFAPTAIGQPESVSAAKVRLKRRGNSARVRRLGIARVRHAIGTGARIRVHRPTTARGKLKLRLQYQPTLPPPGAPPDEEIPTSWSRVASFESDLNSGTDYGWRIDSPFTVTRSTEAGGSDGQGAAKIVTNGGNPSCSCPRMTFDGLTYGAGREVWIGGSWKVTEASKLAWSRLMNLGHFEGSTDPDNWYLGLLVRNSGMEVVARRYDTNTGQSVLMAPRPIPQNRWFDVDVHLVLSPTNGQALTEVFIDGVLVSTSSARNMIGRGPLGFYNAGLSYFWDGNGATTVYFDRARIAG